MNSNEQAEENLYNIENWGEGYFSINSKGNIEISKKPGKKGVELHAIVDAAQQSGITFTLVNSLQ